jgi:hypothetical protein
MRRFVPDKFGWRERWLSLLAVAIAIVFAVITCFYAGMGAGVAWIFFDGVGTVVMIAAAGRDRCFFTALFTSSFAALILIDMLYTSCLDRQGLALKDAVFMMLMVEATVVLPTAFAWLVTKIGKDAKSKDQ